MRSFLVQSPNRLTTFCQSKTPVAKPTPHDTETSTKAQKAEETIIQGGAYKT